MILNVGEGAWDVAWVLVMEWEYITGVCAATWMLGEVRGHVFVGLLGVDGCLYG